MTDCPCGGRYRGEHDHEGRWIRCDRCQTTLPSWREFTDDEIRRRIVIARYTRKLPSGRPMFCKPSKDELSGEVGRRQGPGTDGKPIYDDRATAEKAARELEALGSGPMRSYRCRRSNRGHHHLTTDNVVSRHKAGRNTDITNATRQLVYSRAWMRCEACGRNLAWGGRKVHHRRPRQMGGSRRAETNLAANLLLLCPDCHRQTESHRADAYNRGLLLRTDDVPALVAIEHAVHGFCYLLDDGTVSTDPPQTPPEEN